MRTQSVLTVDAVFEGGLLRPVETLPLRANERVTLRIEIPDDSTGWPEDTEEIYREIAAEDLAIANGMFGDVQKTWPAGGDQ